MSIDLSTEVLPTIILRNQCSLIIQIDILLRIKPFKHISPFSTLVFNEAKSLVLMMLINLSMICSDLIRIL